MRQSPLHRSGWFHVLHWIKRSRPRTPAHAVRPTVARPKTPFDWRAVMREAVVELDAEGRVRSFTPGQQSPLSVLADDTGRYLVDRLRASDRVVFLHALARVRAGEQRVDTAVALRVDEAGREWVQLALALVRGSHSVLALMTSEAAAEPDEAEEADEEVELAAISDPMADLAHELRTPLNAVAGYAGAMRAELFGALNERQHEAMAAIETASEHVVELSNTVLDAARFGASGAVIRENGPIDDSIARACLLVANLAARHRVTIANRVTAKAGALPHDPAALRQIVLNLLSNAVKASPAGATVSIEALRGTDSLEVVIRDAGCGMDPAQLAALGTRFARGKASAGEATGGLGLPLVRRLVEAHDATLSFESDPGLGTVARVSLPLAMEARPTRPCVVPLAAQLLATNANQQGAEPIAPPEQRVG